MPDVVIEPKQDIDMTWYRGSVLTPTQRARRLIQLVQSVNSTVTVAELAAAGQVDVSDVLTLIPVMVRSRLVEPADADLVSVLQSDEPDKAVLRLSHGLAAGVAES